jgi:hypothetical protein
MRIGFVPETEEDDPLPDLYTGGGAISEEEQSQDLSNLGYVKVQLGPFVFEWRLYR